MRILVLCCGILIVANSIVLLWPTSASRADHVYSEQLAVNAHFIRLNKEIEARHLNAPQAVANLTRTPKISAAANQDCYRLGPFVHAANYQLAEAVLMNQQVQYQKFIRQSKSSNAWRIFLGPFDSHAQAVDARTDLTSGKVLDHFIRKRAERDYIVSLGIYSVEASARRALQTLRDDGFLVQIGRENLTLPDNYWLYFVVDKDQQTSRQLARTNWGEASVKLGKVRCAAA